MNDNTIKTEEAVKSQPEEYERCIICGELTDVPMTMPIEMRENYEIGCGQLCARCAKER